mmetsp:Transcript_116509/g.371827  ORF Transcript_116509/g.371827 Transcript_116509/m.371827 type:complete len:272 (+) Transcript_116509:532-1347(+)
MLRGRTGPRQARAARRCQREPRAPGLQIRPSWLPVSEERHQSLVHLPDAAGPGARRDHGLQIPERGPHRRPRRQPREAVGGAAAGGQRGRPGRDDGPVLPAPGALRAGLQPDPLRQCQVAPEGRLRFQLRRGRPTLRAARHGLHAALPAHPGPLLLLPEDTRRPAWLDGPAAGERRRTPRWPAQVRGHRALGAVAGVGPLTRSASLEGVRALACVARACALSARMEASRQPRCLPGRCFVRHASGHQTCLRAGARAAGVVPVCKRGGADRS